MGRLLRNPNAPESNEIPKNPEIPAYTFDELQELNLPGYKKPTYVYDVLGPESDWTPVLSTSIYAVRPSMFSKQAFTAIRKSDTHNQVISTPTMQMHKNYRSLHRLLDQRRNYRIKLAPCELTQEAPLTRALGTVASFSPKPEPLDLRGGSLAWHVNRLNMYKLGLPDMDEIDRSGMVLGTASLCSVHIGFSRVGENENGEPLYEALANVAAAVRFGRTAVKLLSAESEKYEYMGWTNNSETFGEDVRNKDTLQLAPIVGNKAVWYCAYGLCLLTTSEVNSRPDLNGHLAYEEWPEFFPADPVGHAMLPPLGKMHYR